MGLSIQKQQSMKITILFLCLIVGLAAGQECSKIPSWMKWFIDNYRTTNKNNNKYEADRPIPWVVALRFSKRKGAGVYCGGTIIDSNTILTAAHCFDSKDYRKFWVSAGFSQGPDFSQNKRIKKVIKNVNYKEDDHFIDDIAILKLKSPLTLNNRDVGRACLPDSNYYD